MMDKQNQREWMSALADGQLHGDACAQAVAQACDDADAQATWQLYHLVGDVLRSGDHARVERWRRAAALVRTAQHRPDLIEARGGITDEERRTVAEFSMETALQERRSEAGRTSPVRSTGER